MLKINIKAETFPNILAVFGCVSIFTGIVWAIPLLAIAGFILVLIARKSR